MKKIISFILIIMLSIMMFSGCSKNIKSEAAGAWVLTGLKLFDTNESQTFDEEVFILNENGTGMLISLPCNYYEEISFISWKKASIFKDVIEVKHTEDFSYELNVEDISENKMQLSFFYEDDPETYYLASYERMDDVAAKYIGCWELSEIYENDEYFSPNTEYIYLYPNGIVELQYWQEDEEIMDEGIWSVENDILSLDFIGSVQFSYEVYLQNNLLEIYDYSYEDVEKKYIYKRYYGLITNSPPVTYPQNLIEAFNSYLTNIFNRIADSFIK